MYQEGWGLKTNDSKLNRQNSERKMGMSRIFQDKSSKSIAQENFIMVSYVFNHNNKEDYFYFEKE